MKAIALKDFRVQYREGDTIDAAPSSIEKWAKAGLVEKVTRGKAKKDPEPEPTPEPDPADDLLDSIGETEAPKSE